MNPIHISGATLPDGQSADLLIRDGIVTDIGSVSAPADAERVDAAGLIALPGLVDLHTNLREPGF